MIGVRLTLLARCTAPHLTGMERTVLQLIEAGASVHEVGQKLFLTPTSVERHLEAARRRRG
ncbi:MAG TPA: LuxR C-terminal-related transcriptional regulator [Jatrophihabitans sp.]|jgi:DNA-binding NarL/FixJ family response regulator